MAVNSTRRGMLRRGFVFTTVATILILVLIIFATSEVRTLDRTHVQTERVHTMAGYLDNLQSDLPRAAYISGFRSLIAMEEHVSATGAFLPSVDTAFTECFTNGTINGTPYNIMDQSTFADFTTRFNTLAAQQGMTSQITVTSLHVNQTTPWSIMVVANIHIILSDTAGTASFDRSVTINATIPVIDIKDPLYSLGTDGRAPHPVRQSNVTQPYITVTNDTTRLQTLVNQTFYIASPNAPSMLMRFAGNLSASPYGIMSLVNMKELRAQSIPVTSCRSVVDYEYFGNTTTANSFIVNMTQADFWLAAGDLAAFNATGKTVGLAPCP